MEQRRSNRTSTGSAKAHPEHIGGSSEQATLSSSEVLTPMLCDGFALVSAAASDRPAPSHIKRSAAMILLQREAAAV